MPRSFPAPPPARVQRFQGNGSVPAYASHVRAFILAEIKSAIMVSTWRTQRAKYELCCFQSLGNNILMTHFISVNNG